MNLTVKFEWIAQNKSCIYDYAAVKRKYKKAMSLVLTVVAILELAQADRSNMIYQIKLCTMYKPLLVKSSRKQEDFFFLCT